jgi:RNA polymerase sigma-70 factor (ECF subfamily)
MKVVGLETGLSPKQLKEFEIHVKANMKRAYFTALGLLGSHDLAMDASQEAFLRAYKNFNKFDPSKKFFTWFYKILKNLCLNLIRDNKNLKEERFLEFTCEQPASEDIQNKIEQDELINSLQQAIAELTIEEKEIITLREFENYSYKEISELMNIPIGTVMSKLFYVRKKLTQKLAGKI